eukprot:gene31653-39099_t
MPPKPKPPPPPPKPLPPPPVPPLLPLNLRANVESKMAITQRLSDLLATPPVMITSGLPEYFTFDLDAAVLWPDKKAYFFKGSQFVAYDPFTNTITPNYAQTIDDTTWLGVFKEGVDAVVVWPNGKAYFFKGSQYVQFDIEAHKTDDGYPASIKTYWSQCSEESGGSGGVGSSVTPSTPAQ